MSAGVTVVAPTHRKSQNSFDLFFFKKVKKKDGVKFEKRDDGRTDKKMTENM